MFPGIAAASLRTTPWDPLTIVTVNAASADALSFAIVNGTDIYIKDVSVGVRSLSAINGTLTTLYTGDGAIGGGTFHYSNGRFFSYSSTASKLASGTTAAGMSVIKSPAATKTYARISWCPSINSWLVVGDADTTVNAAGLDYTNTGTGLTTITASGYLPWTAAEQCLGIAASSDRILVSGNNGKLATSTTTASAGTFAGAITWSLITSATTTNKQVKNLRYHPNTADGNVWTCADDNGLVAFSTNGTTFALKTIFSTLYPSEVDVIWVPSKNRWMAWSVGNTAAGKGRELAYSNTSSYTGTWTLSSRSTAAADLNNPSDVERGVVVNNSYLLIASNVVGTYKYHRI